MSAQFPVVTGGPCADKASLIQEFFRRSFHTVSDSGRAIGEEMQRGGDARPCADRTVYIERMMERDLLAQNTAQALSGP